jgi:hypothetical protein
VSSPVAQGEQTTAKSDFIARKKMCARVPELARQGGRLGEAKRN